MNPSKGGRDRHSGNTRIIFSPPPPSHFAAFWGFCVPNQLIPVLLITPNMTLLAKSKMAAISTNYSAFTRLQCWIQTHGRLQLIKTHGIWNEETFILLLRPSHNQTNEVDDPSHYTSWSQIPEWIPLTRWRLFSRTLSRLLVWLFRSREEPMNRLISLITRY